MVCTVDDQDFLYEGPDWPPADRVCGGLLAHVPKIGGSRYSYFYQGLARFAVVEHNKSLKDVQLELVKILNLNERIDDAVYWCFFRLEAEDKSSNRVETYRVVVSYLADKHRELRLFKSEGKIPESNRTVGDRLSKLEVCMKVMEQRFEEVVQKMKENLQQLEAELSSMRESHADLQVELAFMKSNMGTRSNKGASTSKAYEMATKNKFANSSSSPPSKKARRK